MGAWFVYTLWFDYPFVKTNEDVKYHVRGAVEVCPETGKLHQHGVVTLWKKTTPKECQRILGFPNGAAWVACMTAKDSREAVAYCKKVGTAFEDGVFVSEVGQRTDLEGAVKCLARGGILKVAEEFPTVYIRYHAGIEKLEDLTRESRAHIPIEDRKWFFIHGPTGVGKTTWIRENFGKDLYVFPNEESNRGKWWNGYASQQYVLIDEYEGGWSEPFMKQLADKWVIKVQTKGGFRDLHYKILFIVSNCSFEQCFKDEHGALRRRFTIIHWKKLGETPLELTNALTNG